MLTTDDVKSTEGDERVDVETVLADLLIQFGDKDLRLFVEHLQEVVKNLEVKTRSQHLPSRLPLLSGAVKWTTACWIQKLGEKRMRMETDTYRTREREREREKEIATSRILSAVDMKNSKTEYRIQDKG